ncbi:MAG: response regulator transcription factor, partial [Anaerolineae bacterium]
MSEREIEVLKLVADGKTNQQIARELVISPNTVKVHLRNIFEKLGVQSRTEATMEAVRRGWVTVGPGTMMPAAAPTIGEATVGAIEPAAEPLFGPEPLAAWQRAYMVILAVLLAALILAPAWWQARGRAVPTTPFSDIGRAEGGTAARSQVARWIARAPLPAPRSRMA